MDRNPTAYDATRMGEFVIRFPALRFHLGAALILVISGLLAGAPYALCLWLLMLWVRQLLFLAGWGSGDMVLISGEASWTPVVGAGLAVLVVALPLTWLIATVSSHWWRRIRRAWWLRLSMTGLEVNDRVFGPRRYAWHEIDSFMQVAPGGRVPAGPQPQKTYTQAYVEALDAGEVDAQPGYVGLRFAPRSGRRRSLRSRLLFHARGADGVRADESVMGYWDRPVNQAVELLEEWRRRCRAV